MPTLLQIFAGVQGEVADDDGREDAEDIDDREGVLVLARAEDVDADKIEEKHDEHQGRDSQRPVAEPFFHCPTFPRRESPEPDLDRDRALSFLKEQHATFTNFIWTERTARGRDGLEAKYGYPNSIPYAALFARSGERLPPPGGERFTKAELLKAIESGLE